MLWYFPHACILNDLQRVKTAKRVLEVMNGSIKEDRFYKWIFSFGRICLQVFQEYPVLFLSLSYRIFIPCAH